MCNAWQKRQLTNEFVTKKNYQEQTRNVGGVAVSIIETDFCRINVMLNRYMPTDTVQAVSLDQCAPVLLESPDRDSCCSPTRWRRPAPRTGRRSTARSAWSTARRSRTTRSPT